MKFNGTKIPKLPSILTEEIGSPLPKEPNGQDPWASEIVRNSSKKLEVPQTIRPKRSLTFRHSKSLTI